MTGLPLLSLAIWLPIVGGLLVLATGSDRYAGLARLLALAVAVTGFLVTLPLYAGFDAGTSAMQRACNSGLALGIGVSTAYRRAITRSALASIAAWRSS